MKYLMVLILLIVIISILSFTSRQYKGMRYAIQNIQTGKNLRPFQAGKQDGNRLVLYNHHNWKCMTWDFKKIADITYQLQNRYTEKTFQVENYGEPNAKLCQKPLTSNVAQQWEFIKQANENYLIRLKDTDLYISISSDSTNSDIILLPLQNTTAQLWKLVKQDPLF